MEGSNVKGRLYSLPKSLYKIEFILILAFIIRILFLFFSNKLNYFSDYSSSLDIKFYQQFATNLYHLNIKKGLIPYVNNFNIILYLFFAPFNFFPFIMRLFMILIDLLNVFLIFAVSKKIFKKRTLIPPIIYTFFAPFIIYSNYPIGETLVITFILLFLFFLKEKPFLSGIFLGIATLGRGNLLIFFILFLGYLIIRKKFSWGFLIGFLLIISLVFIKNISLYHIYSPVSTQGTINFFIGNNEKATGGFVPPTNSGNYNMNNLNQNNSNLLIRKSLNFLLKHPLKSLILYIKKLFLLFSEYSPPLNLNFYFIKYQIPVLFIFPSFAFIFAIFFTLFPCFLKKYEDYFIIEILFILSILPFFSSLRYKLFLVLIPIIFSSLFTFNKKNVVMFVLLFIFFHFIPKPFSFTYGFTGKYLQIAEIDYNNNKKLLAMKNIEKAKKFRKNPQNIGPELFEALIYRESEENYLYVSKMAYIYKVVKKYKYVSYMNQLKKELVYLKGIAPSLYEKFKKIYK